MSVDQNDRSQPRSKSVSSVRVTDRFCGVARVPTTCTSIDTVDGQIHIGTLANIHT
jgi:hypothetical protein